MTSPTVLTRAELADLLRVSTWTIDRLARAGKLPHFHVGSQENCNGS